MRNYLDNQLPTQGHEGSFLPCLIMTILLAFVCVCLRVIADGPDAAEAVTPPDNAPSLQSRSGQLRDALPSA